MTARLQPPAADGEDMVRGIAVVVAALLIAGAATAPAMARGARAASSIATTDDATDDATDDDRGEDGVLRDALESIQEEGADADWDDRAIAGAVTELSGLDDLGALRDDEAVLALITIVDGRIDSVDELQDIDQANARLLADHPMGGDGLRPVVAAVLAPLTPTQLDAVRRGDGSIDAGPWLAAIEGLVADSAATDTEDTEGPAAADAGRASANGRVAIPVTTGVVIGLVAAVVAVALVVLLRRRLGRNRFTAAVAQGTTVVLEASRHMTGATDADEVRRIALRTAVELAGATTGAWIARGGVEGPWWGTATPDAPLGSTDIPGGLIARALETGRVVRGPSIDEPWLATDVGDVTVVPVSEHGAVVGAMVVTGTEEVEGPTATSLEALAPVTAAALAAASAHRGAIDASYADALTGLPNRRRLDQDLTGAGRTGRFSLAMVDVDHFKQFNDHHGHGAGDLALQLVARALSGAVRAGDTVYRYGGEEFCVLLPRATDATVVKAVAERLRSSVASTVIPGGEHQPTGRVTVSVGIAVRVGEQPVDEVLFAADAALYRAKNAGRDQAMIAG